MKAVEVRWSVALKGGIIGGPFTSEAEAWGFIHRHQGQSVDYALKYAGYSIHAQRKTDDGWEGMEDV